MLLIVSKTVSFVICTCLQCFFSTLVRVRWVSHTAVRRIKTTFDRFFWLWNSTWRNSPWRCFRVNSIHNVILYLTSSINLILWCGFCKLHRNQWGSMGIRPQHERCNNLCTAFAKHIYALKLCMPTHDLTCEICTKFKEEINSLTSISSSLKTECWSDWSVLASDCLYLL